MFDTTKFEKVKINSLYKWHKTYGNIQKKYFKNDVKIRREKQIEDFVYLNGFKKIKLLSDNYVLQQLSKLQVNNYKDADLTIITDQRFSRYPCSQIIIEIEKILEKCPNLYLCLNRYYINIDDTFTDNSLPDNPNLAITTWLKKNLKNYSITDLSLDYDDDGTWFTWVIPDRHFYIKKI